ncbi:DegT/DnrJ/EryC1/StrS family aminotransferase [Streptomyces sporangiiformans]|uniref:DegT/DnrJ/EryC1/StrS family aminotransferase n=1 Tax=Streptomyces sporangiiformans TaxID=2315329 RepID=A0A505DR84_9ACTN|nr:DegT/DnrJ/EryC1/StrS family aminotransferase [Streptomyces sporangiiformans]TPQ23695.1 DegT/DnrJ/EryC1/StrS family aminotransferase [Streptomyces sporangiiformans]
MQLTSSTERGHGDPFGTGRPRVPFFSQAASFERVWPEIQRHLREVVERGKYSHGHKVADFESALADFTGARHAIAVNSATDALILLLRAAGLRPGDEVVVPAMSFVASASSVVLAGGRPVFADIDPVSYALDPASAAAAVTPRTRFVMPVHLFWQMAEMDALTDMAAEKGLTIVEDSAEAIGMRWNGKHAGLLGAGGVLSFFPAKTLGALGDAGAVLTDDDEIAETVSALRHHGRFGPTVGDFRRISTETTVSGVNSKMDDIQAAVLLAKLGRLGTDIARRAEIAARYTERLAHVPVIRRLPAVVPRKATTNPVHYVYLVEVDHRDELARFLARHGIGTETYYPIPLHRQPAFAEFGHSVGGLPHAEAACRYALALPLHADLTDDQVDYVCETIQAFAGGGAA